MLFALPLSYQLLLLTTIGLFVGAIGTLVGAGGGFLLVPLLLVLMPGNSAATITAISMAVVFCNALSGTFAYARLGRVDWNAGLRFAIAAIPGSFLGAWATAFIPRKSFELIFGSILSLIAVFLLWRVGTAQRHAAPSETGPFQLSRSALRQGCVLSAGVGFLSSVLGIGGGIVHVPALVYLLRYPVHVATATSHFVLAATSAVAVGEHLLHGNYQDAFVPVVTLGSGALAGAQLGASLSRHMKGHAIVICLALALIFAGLRIAWKALA